MADSFASNRLIQVQEHARHRPPGFPAPRVLVTLFLCELLLKQLGEALFLSCRRTTRKAEAKGVLNRAVGVDERSFEDAIRQRLGEFIELLVIQQRECLERCIARNAARAGPEK